jgi:hypothetical protein
MGLCLEGLLVCWLRLIVLVAMMEVDFPQMPSQRGLRCVCGSGLVLCRNIP